LKQQQLTATLDTTNLATQLDSFPHSTNAVIDPATGASLEWRLSFFFADSKKLLAVLF
jgi:hypothetical protein